MPTSNKNDNNKLPPQEIVESDSERSNEASMPPKKRSKHNAESQQAADTAASEIEKKRLASRESSRRTREREKMRMDHFTNSKYKLEQANKKIKAENDELRSLIKLLQDSKAMVASKHHMSSSTAIPTVQPPIQVHAPPAPIVQQPQQGHVGDQLLSILSSLTNPSQAAPAPAAPVPAIAPVPPPVPQAPQQQTEGMEQQLSALLTVCMQTNNPALNQLVVSYISGLVQSGNQAKPPVQQPQQSPMFQPQPVPVPSTQPTYTQSNHDLSQQLLAALVQQGGVGAGNHQLGQSWSNGA
eukprot:Nitzschia sp. Nitz4//scaffold72_size95085//39668//40558//NITZ4_004755-RA/size95085-processed-gene-0.95-mRNA-1//-1//CDS//3329557360//4400//frame0